MGILARVLTCISRERIPVLGAVPRQEGRSMAVYEFECQACHERFEVKQPMHESERLRSDPPACPGCGKKQTRQVVSLFSCKPPTG